jgi:lipoprotein-anchoring transpeptidase ErfK/SrfK
MSSPLMRRNTMVLKVAVPVVTALVLLCAVGAFLWSNSSSTQAAATYQQRRQALDARLRVAGQQGFTSQDLAPITSQERTLDTANEPWWLPGRTAFYQHETSQVTSLQVQLDALQRRLSAQAQTDAGAQVGDARTQIGQAQQANAPDPDVQGLQQRLDAAVKLQGAAHTLKDYRAVAQQARDVGKAASALLTQTQQENQAIQQTAPLLVAQTGGNLGALQQAGNQQLATARNDASIAAYLNVSSPYKTWAAVQKAYSRLEKFAPMIGSGDVNTVAVGVAAAQRFSGQIHDAYMSGLPDQVVVVSFQDQHMWAYQKGQVVMETPTTSGIKGVSDFGTDLGPMKVLWKDHPHVMKSPWPKSSPYYYPDTTVQWATFFTNTGESIHDASWQADSTLGPGSQYNPSYRSHGCLHVPLDRAQWMYNWAPLGMPVVVFPGDGTPVANQLSQMTTDSNGTPKSAGG